MKQLLRSSGWRTFSAVYYLYDIYRLNGRKLNGKETEDLIIKCLNDQACTYLVVDALDECDSSLRAALLSELQKIQEQAKCFVHVLTSCRTHIDADYKPNFKEAQSVEIQNENDIQYYIEHRLDLGFARNIFMPELQPFKSEMRAKLVEKANGM